LVTEVSKIRLFTEPKTILDIANISMQNEYIFEVRAALLV
jgi:hypothetical protein